MSFFKAITLSAILALGGQTGVLASERAEQAWQLIKQGAVLVDVRTDWEFNAGHVEGALHIPLQALSQRLNELPAKDHTIVVYCRSGNRSGQAQHLLTQLGYSAVHNGGGLNEMLSRQPK